MVHPSRSAIDCQSFPWVRHMALSACSVSLDPWRELVMSEMSWDSQSPAQSTLLIYYFHEVLCKMIPLVSCLKPLSYPWCPLKAVKLAIMTKHYDYCICSASAFKMTPHFIIQLTSALTLQIFDSRLQTTLTMWQSALNLGCVLNRPRRKCTSILNRIRMWNQCRFSEAALLRPSPVATTFGATGIHMDVLG